MTDIIKTKRKTNLIELSSEDGEHTYRFHPLNAYAEYSYSSSEGTFRIVTVDDRLVNYIPSKFIIFNRVEADGKIIYDNVAATFTTEYDIERDTTYFIIDIEPSKGGSILFMPNIEILEKGKF